MSPADHKHDVQIDLYSQGFLNEPDIVKFKLPIFLCNVITYLCHQHLFQLSNASFQE